VRGFNVTAPYKAAALATADRADAAAEAAGAANLLLFEADGTVTARNTDGVGLLHALRTQADWRPQGRTVIVVGAGGAARGATAALLTAGVSHVRVLNRTEARAQALVKALGQETAAFPLERAGEAARGADLLVNAAAGGDLVLDAALEALRPGAVVMDMNYRPLLTPLLAEAVRRGLAVVDGLEMLIGQAIPSFEAFFGRPPPEVDVRRLALDALGEPA
jgi:shikimate dehydrogenase